MSPSRPHHVDNATSTDSSHSEMTSPQTQRERERERLSTNLRGGNDLARRIFEKPLTTVMPVTKLHDTDRQKKASRPHPQFTHQSPKFQLDRARRPLFAHPRPIGDGVRQMRLTRFSLGQSDRNSSESRPHALRVERPRRTARRSRRKCASGRARPRSLPKIPNRKIEKRITQTRTPIDPRPPQPRPHRVRSERAADDLATTRSRRAVTAQDSTTTAVVFWVGKG